jgi:hypothetical protein
MTYRDDVEALENRHRVLEGEIAARARARDEVAGMIVEARARRDVEAHLADLEAGGPSRRRRKRILIAIAAGLFVLAGAGVAVKLAEPERDLVEEALARFAMYADDMCGCKDIACAEKVQHDMMEWGRKMSKQLPVPQITEAQQKRATDIAMRMAKCEQKAKGFGVDPEKPAEQPSAAQP